MSDTYRPELIDRGDPDELTRFVERCPAQAQAPQRQSVYSPHAPTKLNGAPGSESRGAVAMGAISRHGSTVLNGMQVDLAAFKQETDTVLKLAGEKATTASKTK